MATPKCRQQKSVADDIKDVVPMLVRVDLTRLDPTDEADPLTVS
jgi:hypothetical protein